MRFEEWALSYQPADEEIARDAWNAAIEAAATLPAGKALTDIQTSALVQPDADPDARKRVLLGIWTFHQRRIQTLKAKEPADF